MNIKTHVKSAIGFVYNHLPVISQNSIRRSASTILSKALNDEDMIWGNSGNMVAILNLEKLPHFSFRPWFILYHTYITIEHIHSQPFCISILIQEFYYVEYNTI